MCADQLTGPLGVLRGVLYAAVFTVLRGPTFAHGEDPSGGDDDLYPARTPPDQRDEMCVVWTGLHHLFSPTRTRPGHHTPTKESECQERNTHTHKLVNVSCGHTLSHLCAPEHRRCRVGCANTDRHTTQLLSWRRRRRRLLLALVLVLVSSSCLRMLPGGCGGCLGRLCLIDLVQLGGLVHLWSDNEEER